MCCARGSKNLEKQKERKICRNFRFSRNKKPYEVNTNHKDKPTVESGG